MALTAVQLRQLAVALMQDGQTPEQVADGLGVSERSVWRWVGVWRQRGDAGC